MKVIGTLMTVGLVLSLVGCGGKSPEQEKKIEALTKQVENLKNKANEAEKQRRAAQDKVVELEAKIKFLEGKGATTGGEPKTNGGATTPDKSGATNTEPKPPGPW